MKDKKIGFTLVEIMIVISIIAVLVVIAVPNYLKSRITANETAAVANCLHVSNACQLYHINTETYPETLGDLIGPKSNPPYVDSAVASGKKQGYEFVYNLENPGHFTLNANPVSIGIFKGRYFYIDEAATVHVKEGAPAGQDDPIFR